MASLESFFRTVRSEGGLLPTDLLQRVADGDTGFEGLSPETYNQHGRRLNEAIAYSWNGLINTWSRFQAGLAKLPSGDPATKITRDRWLLPLYNELQYIGLKAADNGITVNGKSYPISHWYEEIPIHLVGVGVSLDHRTPGVVGASTGSPFSLVQTVLNFREESLWGFASNGRKLRVLRDNARLTQQAFVEFDLEAMMNGEMYSDFTVFWLTCHQTRLKADIPADSWLEKWSQAAQAQSTRALDDLRNRVQESIEHLGCGFLAWPGNERLRENLRERRLPEERFYRQLLRLVYRLIILFTAEDRDLLHPKDADASARARYAKYYSTRKLRNLAERSRGTSHGDLYELLKIVMLCVGGDSGYEPLALPALDSDLFSDEESIPDLAGCGLPNVDFLAAIRSLAFTLYENRLRPIDYRNLGSEELGSVYESLLELHPAINIDAAAFKLLVISGNERKTTGAYYTKPVLVRPLLDSALEPVIERATKGKKQAEAVQALLNLKVCDPACGSGHFLIGAARRIGYRLAQIRSREYEPSPDEMRSAIRDVINHCIYGVDINPTAIEICKVAFWLESLDPGKPLSFLDHRILTGNSLFGTTPELIEGGIPSDAFNPIEGDDKKFAANLRKQNKATGKNGGVQLPLELDGVSLLPSVATLAEQTRQIDSISSDSVADIHAKKASRARRDASLEYQMNKIMADAWCAAFVQRKAENGSLPISNAVLRWLLMSPDQLPNNLQLQLSATRAEITRLAHQYHFFHWKIEFPEVFDSSERDPGFDCILGNPAWDRIKLQEKEWFAAHNANIAEASNTAMRHEMIAELAKSDPDLLNAFFEARRTAEGESHFTHTSGRYTLTGHGDVNTYALFIELDRSLINSTGRVGCIAPSGIATDDTTKTLFQDLISSKSLVSLYDFENREGLFRDIDSRFKFSLLTLSGKAAPVTDGSQFVFFALRPEQLGEPERRFTLSADDIALINPNTLTCATFRSRRDAELAKAIYRRYPVLIREGDPEGNPWGVSFLRMFDMSNDSHLFHTQSQLEATGWRLNHNRFEKDNETSYLPLYEAKMLHQYNHRWATYEGSNTRDVTLGEKDNPTQLVLPRYWVTEFEATKHFGKSQNELLGFRRLATPTNERSFIATILPKCAAGDSVFFVFTEYSPVPLLTNFNSFIFDYLWRQKLTGVNANFFIVKQLPVLPPTFYDAGTLAFIFSRVLELLYTALDLASFARNLGYEGAPFHWNEDRRFIIRCELDALYFHLYGIDRDDVAHIMDTFPIIRRKDEDKYEEYRTKRFILESYDMMVNGIENYHTPLDPPPGDPCAAHST